MGFRKRGGSQSNFWLHEDRSKTDDLPLKSDAENQDSGGCWKHDKFEESQQEIKANVSDTQTAKSLHHKYLKPQPESESPADISSINPSSKSDSFTLEDTGKWYQDVDEWNGTFGETGLETAVADVKLDDDSKYSHDNSSFGSNTRGRASRRYMRVSSRPSDRVENIPKEGTVEIKKKLIHNNDARKDISINAIRSDNRGITDIVGNISKEKDFDIKKEVVAPRNDGRKDGRSNDVRNGQPGAKSNDNKNGKASHSRDNSKDRNSRPVVKDYTRNQSKDRYIKPADQAKEKSGDHFSGGDEQKDDGKWYQDVDEWNETFGETGSEIAVADVKLDDKTSHYQDKSKHHQDSTLWRSSTGGLRESNRNRGNSSERGGYRGRGSGRGYMRGNRGRGGQRLNENTSKPQAHSYDSTPSYAYDNSEHWQQNYSEHSDIYQPQMPNVSANGQIAYITENGLMVPANNYMFSMVPQPYPMSNQYGYYPSMGAVYYPPTTGQTATTILESIPVYYPPSTTKKDSKIVISRADGSAVELPSRD